MSESNTTVYQFVVFFWARWPVGLFPWSSLVGCEVVVLISLPWPYHCYYISHNNNLVFSNCCSSRPLWATGGRIWSASWFSRGHWGDFHLICGLFILHQENPGFLTPLPSLQKAPKSLLIFIRSSTCPSFSEALCSSCVYIIWNYLLLLLLQTMTERIMGLPLLRARSLRSCKL